MNIKLSLSFFLMIIFICNCDLQKEIDLKIPDSDSELVIIGYISLNEGVVVHISKTIPLFKGSVNQFLTIPKVTLHTNNQESIILEKGSDELYRTPDSFQSVLNAYYQLTVDVEGFPLAYSNPVGIPFSLAIQNVSWEWVDTSSNRDINLHFEFDKINEYYSVLYKLDTCSSLTKLNNMGELLTDNQSSSSYNQISKHLYLNQSDSVVTISLFHLSEDLFRFLESTAAQEFSIDDELEDPIFVESNITNGHGVFGAYSKISKQIIF